MGEGEVKKRVDEVRVKEGGVESSLKIFKISGK